MLVHIGFDDLDSLSGGCTTYVCALMIEELSNFPVKFMDYPNLIRLNPNIPWKTRGNGAVCLRIEADEETLPELKDSLVELIKTKVDLMLLLLIHRMFRNMKIEMHSMD